jgi:predicted dehydrogenase
LSSWRLIRFYEHSQGEKSRMTGKLKVGILGAGIAGTGHATSFSQLPNVEVAALWSRTRSRAKALVDKLKLANTQVYDSWQELVEQADVQIVTIATPEFLRREPLAMALARGCHVLVEKPLGVELEDAQELVRLAETAGAVTATCYVWRYAPGTQAAWQAMQDGRIGRLLDVRMEWLARVNPRIMLQWLPWVADVPTGILAMGGSHEFDRARFLAGCEFEQIVGRVTPFSLSNEPEYVVPSGTYALVANMSDGVLGQFRSTLTAGQSEWNLVLNGEEGNLYATMQSATLQCAGEENATTLDIPSTAHMPEGTPLNQHVWNRLIADFVTAVRTDDVKHTSVPHLPTLVDGLRVQEVIQAARLADAERRWVDIGQELR